MSGFAAPSNIVELYALCVPCCDDTGLLRLIWFVLPKARSGKTMLNFTHNEKLYCLGFERGKNECVYFDVSYQSSQTENIDSSYLQKDLSYLQDK